VAYLEEINLVGISISMTGFMRGSCVEWIYARVMRGLGLCAGHARTRFMRGSCAEWIYARVMRGLGLCAVHARKTVFMQGLYEGF
jgi:hypothetical protein